jgi:ABC-type bacteriocin/lantibiotic exporter with double-glycine peptidase domain
MVISGFFCAILVVFHFGGSRTNKTAVIIARAHKPYSLIFFPRVIGKKLKFFHRGAVGDWVDSSRLPACPIAAALIVSN